MEYQYCGCVTGITIQSPSDVPCRTCEAVELPISHVPVPREVPCAFVRAGFDYAACEVIPAAILWVERMASLCRDGAVLVP